MKKFESLNEGYTYTTNKKIIKGGVEVNSSKPIVSPFTPANQIPPPPPPFPKNK